jgi:hypothetical protein
LGWLAVLIPFLDGYGTVNIVLIAALAPLLCYDYDSISPGHIGVRRRR